MNIHAPDGAVTEIAVADIKFRGDLYPRIEMSAVTVQKYAEDIDVLPPIEVNQHNELIDGWHRWTGHKKVGAQKIRAVVTPTESDTHLLELAIERNSSHGLQLSQADKRDMARKIYVSTPIKEQGEKKRRLAAILSVDLSTVQKWLSHIDKDNREKRDCAARSMWLACYTQEEISAALGMPQQTVADILPKNGDLRFPVNLGDLVEIQDDNKFEVGPAVGAFFPPRAPPAAADPSANRPLSATGAKTAGNMRLSGVSLEIGGGVV